MANWVESQVVFRDSKDIFEDIVEYTRIRAIGYGLRIINAQDESIWLQAEEKQFEAYLKGVKKNFSKIDILDYRMRIPEPQDESISETEVDGYDPF